MYVDQYGHDIKSIVERVVNEIQNWVKIVQSNKRNKMSGNPTEKRKKLEKKNKWKKHKQSKRKLIREKFNFFSHFYHANNTQSHHSQYKLAN